MTGSVLSLIPFQVEVWIVQKGVSIISADPLDV